MKKLLYLIVLLGLTSCYEYRKLPNTQRIRKIDVRKAMKYSSWKYNNKFNYRTSLTY